MKFKDKIVLIRKNLGLSQEEFGQLFNVSRQTISKWELGQSTPDMQMLSTICEKLNVSSEYLLRDGFLNSNQNNNSDLIKLIKYKRLFLLGVIIIFLGVTGLIMQWIEIRIGSNYYLSYIDVLFNPSYQANTYWYEKYIFASFIIILLIGFYVAIRSSFIKRKN